MGALTAASLVYSIRADGGRPYCRVLRHADARLGVRCRRCCSRCSAARGARGRRCAPRSPGRGWRRSRPPSSYSAATPFPGVAALLPVLGALAVIWAGAPSARWAPSGALCLRPVQLLGDISYSVYLWHWPLLILAPYRARPPRTGAVRSRSWSPRWTGWAEQGPRRRPVRAGLADARAAPGCRSRSRAVGTAAVVVIAVAGAGALKVPRRDIEDARAELSAHWRSRPHAFAPPHAIRLPAHAVHHRLAQRIVVQAQVEERGLVEAGRCTRVEASGTLNV